MDRKKDRLHVGQQGLHSELAVTNDLHIPVVVEAQRKANHMFSLSQHPLSRLALTDNSVLVSASTPTKITTGPAWPCL